MAESPEAAARLRQRTAKESSRLYALSRSYRIPGLLPPDIRKAVRREMVNSQIRKILLAANK